MPKERDTRKPKGFSFCQYKRKEDAEDAIKGMNGRVSVKTFYRELRQLVLRNYIWPHYTLMKYIVCVKMFKQVIKPLFDRTVPPA